MISIIAKFYEQRRPHLHLKSHRTRINSYTANSELQRPEITDPSFEVSIKCYTIPARWTFARFCLFILSFSLDRCETIIEDNLHL